MNAQSQRQLDARLRARFQRRLLNWYEKNKRDLPWRRTHDAYRIWVAEIMLQQTTVATVIPYYERFLARFPTLRDLADAPRDDVLRWWAGLGYYARARNLHKAAQEVVKRYDGSIPQNPQELGSLPGVGRYTAGAILSIAFNQEVPLLDGNVTRVLCRVFHVTGDPARSPALRRLWSLAEELIPKGKAREFNQAMMELGALVCTPTPRCEVCPVGGLCEAKQLNKQTQLPAPTRKRTIKEVEDVAALIRWEGDASAKPSGWEGDAPAKPSGWEGDAPAKPSGSAGASPFALPHRATSAQRLVWWTVGVPARHDSEQRNARRRPASHAARTVGRQSQSRLAHRHLSAESRTPPPHPALLCVRPYRREAARPRLRRLEVGDLGGDLAAAAFDGAEEGGGGVDTGGGAVEVEVALLKM